MHKYTEANYKIYVGLTPLQFRGYFPSLLPKKWLRLFERGG